MIFRPLYAILVAHHITDSQASAVVTTENVSYMDGEAQLTGYIAYPTESSGQLPLVMHVHTWSGLTDFEKQRAVRTAAELGYVGFAVSVYTDEENAASAGNNMQTKIANVGKYSAAPELFVSRLTAAANIAKAHARVDPTRLAAAGYCFGGSAVLQFAKLGGAAAAGVAAVASFHGGLDAVLLPSGLDYEYCPTRVAVYNGAADAMIPNSDIAELEAVLETSKTVWEVSTYANAGHGFTHPTDGSDHFHFEQVAERRSWTSMASFVATAWEHHEAGQLSFSSCALMAPVPEDPTNASTDCTDDDAGVAAIAGAWGATECSANLCEGDFAETMRRLCPKTCGLCDDDEGANSPMTCGAVKELYRKNECCGQPEKPFAMSRRLTDASKPPQEIAAILAALDTALQRATETGGEAKAKALRKRIREAVSKSTDSLRS